MSSGLIPVIAVSDGRLDVFGANDLWFARPVGSEGTCGLRRGTAAGRKRHERIGEPMCGSCGSPGAQANRLADPDNWHFG